MKIINLIEDTKGNPLCHYEHGLSFYIETAKHRILLDTGATGAFLKNAEILGVDLKSIDTVIISHGHYDHTGGLTGFLSLNPGASVYMQKTALNDYYHQDAEECRYIGADKKIGQFPQIIFADGNLQIDEELSLFVCTSRKQPLPRGNASLKYKSKGIFFPDDFGHEQYLVITLGCKKTLLSGCAHNGIQNILEEYFRLFGNSPDVVISGFHMMQKAAYTEDDTAMIKETAGYLKKLPTKFYTGHCTGDYPFEILKKTLGNQLERIRSGETIL